MVCFPDGRMTKHTGQDTGTLSLGHIQMFNHSWNSATVWVKLSGPLFPQQKDGVGVGALPV